MLVLVDGYNVTMRDPALSSRSKEVQRDALVALVAGRAQSLHGRGARVVVVFDAHDSLGHVSDDSGIVKTVYANIADDEIVRRCAASSGNVVVYSADMRLRARISQDVGRRVEYRDVSALFVGASPSSKRRKAGARRGDSELPPDANEITSELAEQWLHGDKE